MHNMEQSDGDCASWDAIRTLITECPDLSQDAVQSLIAQGDEPAVALQEIQPLPKAVGQQLEELIARDSRGR